MTIKKETYNAYLKILQKELILAFGCTEPIAIAYAASIAREIMGDMPDRILVECSGNVIKNVKSVIVPATGGLKGIDAAAIIGAVGGHSEMGLEVLSKVKAEDVSMAQKMLQEKICETKLLDTPAKLHIIIHMWSKKHSTLVEIIHEHNNVVRVEKDGSILVDVPYVLEEINSSLDYKRLNIKDIIAFSDIVNISDVQQILERQIKYNSAISIEGLTGKYGVAVGKTLLDQWGNDVKVRACAGAAAGSDARMGGCELPVVINCGSGNQGLTVSVPVITYMQEYNKTMEELYRALCVSNLIAIHLKVNIGRLSAYCGVVSAGAAAGAGIMYMMGGREKEIENVLTNALGNISGIVCDGAKPSCAAKIASSVNAGLMGIYLAYEGHSFMPGDGIVKDEIEKTIQSVSKLARDGMRTTDKTILNIMVNSSI